MLPILLYNNMEGCSNSLNNSVNNPGTSFSIYDENIILNSVRNRKKVTELPNCPVCSCTIRHGELESHLSLEIERLHKLSSGGTKRKLSVNSSGGPMAVAGSSSGQNEVHDEEVDVSGCFGSADYQRVRANRLRRLRARRRSPALQTTGECPICNETLPTSKLQRHALRCLRKTGAEMDEDVPDTSSEDESIDVENDEPGGRFGSEYTWGDESRVRVTALQEGGLRGVGVPLRRASVDTALVVDGDEDTELYGPPQYSPSRIAPDAEIPDPPQQEDPLENRTEERTENRIEKINGEDTHNEKEVVFKPNGLVEASAETRIQALKAKIRELEKKQNTAADAKCLICLGPHVSPTVSIQCWHVYCEVCWLQSLKAKKICPQCNAITTASHLRRIYM